MRKMVPRLLNWPGKARVVILCVFLFLLSFGTGPVCALDSNKRLTQYMHTSWRMQDGSAPAVMFSIAQTSDGFLWFLSSRGDIYRFDGVRFGLWHPPAAAAFTGTIENILGDPRGGLWMLGAQGIVHLKDGVVTSSVHLNGLLPDTNNVSQDADGSIWVVRGDNSVTEPVCHVTERSMKCFGKSDGIPISPIDAILADGNGGFWLGGQAALVHWHAGASESYPLKGMRSGAGPGILSLARGSDGTIWAGIFSDGTGLGLARLQDGAVRSFIAPAFDGSKVIVFALRFDRDGNLWVGTANKGIFRVHGNNVDHYAELQSLSGDFVRVLFEDEGWHCLGCDHNGMTSFTTPWSPLSLLWRGPGVRPGRWSSGQPRWHDLGCKCRVASTTFNGAVSSILRKHGLPGHQVAS